MEALLKRLGPNAYPFTMEITPLAPPSVQLVPAKEYTGAPIGTSYDVRAYIADRSDEKFNRRTTIRMGIRVVQRAFAPPSPYDYNPKGGTSTSNRAAKQHKITLFGCRSAPLHSSKLFPQSQTPTASADGNVSPSRDPCGTAKVKSKSATASLEASRCVEDDVEMKDNDSSEESNSPSRFIQATNHEAIGDGVVLPQVTTKVEFVDGTNIVVNCVNVGGDICATPIECKSSDDNVSKFADDDDDDVDVVKDGDRDRLAVPGTSTSCRTALDGSCIEDEIMQCPDSEQMEQMRSMCSSKRPSLAVFIAEIPQPHATVEKPFLLSDGKVELDGTLNKAVYHHGEEVKITVQIRNNSSKTIRRIKVFIVQHVDVCMFSKGKFKNVVASVNVKDDCPIGPKSHLDHTYALIPVKGATKNWIALEDSYTKAGTSLASSVTSSTNRPEERNVFAIYVSYYVKIKLMMSVLGGVVALKLPFTLMHTCNDFDPNSTLTRVVMPPQQLTLDLCPFHQRQPFNIPPAATTEDPSLVT